MFFTIKWIVYTRDGTGYPKPDPKKILKTRPETWPGLFSQPAHPWVILWSDSTSLELKLFFKIF